MFMAIIIKQRFLIQGDFQDITSRESLPDVKWILPPVMNSKTLRMMSESTNNYNLPSALARTGDQKKY